MVELEVGVFKWPWNERKEMPHRSCFTLLIDDYVPWRVLRPEIALPESLYADLNRVFEQTGHHCVKYSICPLAEGVNWVEDPAYSAYVEELLRAQTLGISLGLEGLTHYYVYDLERRALTNLPELDFFNTAGEEEIHRYMNAGVEILGRKGVGLSGFTSPFFCGDQPEAYKAFNRLGWTWSFNTHGLTQGNDPVVRHGAVSNLPSYENSSDLFGGGGAPPATEVRADQARACVDAASLNGEMCALYTHFQGIHFSGSLEAIEGLLAYVEAKEDIWMGSAEEIGNFWAAKEALRRRLSVTRDHEKDQLHIRGYYTPTKGKVAVWVVPPQGYGVAEAKLYHDAKEAPEPRLAEKPNYSVIVAETEKHRAFNMIAQLKRN